MAIIGKMEVEVLVGGAALHEYEDNEMDNEDPNLVVRYIEANSGAPFSIKNYVPGSYELTSDAVSFHIVLDGKWTTGRLLRKVNSSKEGSWETIVAGINKNGFHNGSLRPFIFSEVARGVCLW